MSRDPRYQRLLNSKQWKTLRIAYLRQHPLCERCIREGKAAGVPEGYIRSSVDCHHRVPVETAKTLAEMERLCFDFHNLEALCIACHSRTHKEIGRGKAMNKQRAEQRFDRWRDNLTQRFTNNINTDNGQHQDEQHGGDRPR